MPGAQACAGGPPQPWPGPRGPPCGGPSQGPQVGCSPLGGGLVFTNKNARFLDKLQTALYLRAEKVEEQVSATAGKVWRLELARPG